MLVVTTPADDPLIMTAAQMRAAAGLADADHSRDAEFLLLNQQISARIYEACNIAVGSGGEPTLRQETLTETKLVPNGWPIVLSRRHNVEVTTLTGWSGVSVPDDYFVDAESGVIRYSTDPVVQVTPGRSKVVIVYKAGFEVTPPTLVAAASDMVRLSVSETSRDPLVKSVRIDVDGVDQVQTDYWVNSAGSTNTVTSVPPQIKAMLRRFFNPAYA